VLIDQNQLYDCLNEVEVIKLVDGRQQVDAAYDFTEQFRLLLL